MLFKKPFWEGLRSGTITLAFRRWKKPTVKAGGTLRSPVGTLHIESVRTVPLSSLNVEQAKRAGFDTLAALKAELAKHEGALHRIELRFQGEDDRPALRQDTGAEALEDIATRLGRIDERSARGPWTTRFLELIRDHPGTRAPDLAAQEDLETVVFKRDVRKLKALGLTESLKVGYRLSPRGLAYLGLHHRP